MSTLTRISLALAALVLLAGCYLWLAVGPSVVFDMTMTLCS